MENRITKRSCLSLFKQSKVLFGLNETHKTHGLILLLLVLVLVVVLVVVVVVVLVVLVVVVVVVVVEVVEVAVIVCSVFIICVFARTRDVIYLRRLHAAENTAQAAIVYMRDLLGWLVKSSYKLS